MMLSIKFYVKVDWDLLAERCGCVGRVWSWSGPGKVGTSKGVVCWGEWRGRFVCRLTGIGWVRSCYDFIIIYLKFIGTE